MKKPDRVLRELGQLYEFHRELAKFRFKEETPAAKDGGTTSPPETPVERRRVRDR